MWVSAGNAWAAAGMLRVLGTLKSSHFSRNFSNQIKDLGNWVTEIHTAMYPYLVRLPQPLCITLSPNACVRPFHSKPMVCSRTTQMRASITISTTHRAARCLLLPSTASHFSLAIRSLSGKRSSRVQHSLQRMAHLPPHLASLWSRPHRRFQHR